MSQLDDLMQPVLQALRMRMHGSTTSWNPTTSGSRDRNPGPTGEAHPEEEEFARRYNEATNELAKQRVYHEAREFLERWRGHGIERAAAETQQALDARMVAEGEGWTVDEVARAFHCTPTRVRRACQEHRVEIDYRNRLCEAGAVSRVSLAQTMTDAGRSQQQIAQVLGIHQCNVSRLLKTARKAA